MGGGDASAWSRCYDDADGVMLMGMDMPRDMSI